MMTSEKLTIKTGSKELDLMPIKLNDIQEWTEVSMDPWPGISLSFSSYHLARARRRRGLRSSRQS